MQRFPFFLALTVAAAFAPAASADTETTDTTRASQTEASAESADAEATQLADADTDTEAKADSDSQGDPAAAAEGEEGNGSGDADAGGPVDATAPDGTPADDEGTDGKKDSKKAGTVKEELTPDGKKKPKKDLATGEGAPAALAPGGVVGGGSTFPLGITVSSTTNVGAGTFAIGSTNNPSVTSSLALRPRFMIPKLVDWQPSAMLTGFLGVDIDWISSQTGGFQTGPRDRQLRISDASMSLILPALVREPFSGISVTPILTLRAPLSVASRFANRVVGVSPAVLVGWSLPTPFGIGAIQYVGAGTYWEHTTNSPTIPCGERLPTGGNFFPGTGFADGVSDIPMHIGRVEEIDANGQCRVRGRQIIGTLVNQITFAYTLPTRWGMHTLSVGGGIFNIFNRPLEYKPELRSAFAQPQSFINTTPLTTSNISYNYAVPGEWVPFGANVQLSAGISAFNAMFDGRGFINPPTDLIFWAPRSTGDAPAGLVLSPSRNNTTGFASLTVGI